MIYKDKIILLGNIVNFKKVEKSKQVIITSKIGKDRQDFTPAGLRLRDSRNDLFPGKL